MMIKRTIQDEILNRLHEAADKNKVIIIYGSRQVGKTTLIKEIEKNFEGKAEYYNCDFLNVQHSFAYENAINFKNIVRNLDLLILDEAQRIKNIGMVLKILVDNFPYLKIIATGSSSFELSNLINEPLTGRKRVYKLFPFSFTEVEGKSNYLESKVNIQHYLRFGFYPALINKNEKEIIEILDEICGSYLFKDILNFKNIKKPEVLKNLLLLLAFQVGNEISYTEISNKLGIDHSTVQNFIYLLEESFIIFRLPALKRNLRNEIGKSRKVYFWDLGIRNSLIQNCNKLDLRNDIGALWENFCIVERLKFMTYHRAHFNTFFWRTYSQKEIDYIEESGGLLTAFEFKYSAKKKIKIPSDFAKAYPEYQFRLIHPENFIDSLFRK